MFGVTDQVTNPDISSPSPPEPIPATTPDVLGDPSWAGEFELAHPTAWFVLLELRCLLKEGGVNGRIRSPQDKLHVLLRSKYRDRTINVAEDVVILEAARFIKVDRRPGPGNFYTLLSVKGDWPEIQAAISEILDGREHQRQERQKVYQQQQQERETKRVQESAGAGIFRTPATSATATAATATATVIISFTHPHDLCRTRLPLPSGGEVGGVVRSSWLRLGL